MNVIVPIEITPARLFSSTAAEPGPGEVAWSASTAYVVGDQCYSPTTHRRFQAAVAHTNRNPDTDAVFPAAWGDIGPTNKWAAFDNVRSTQTVAEDTLTMVIKPGFFNSLYLGGLLGARLAVTVRSAPAGPVIYSYDKALDSSRPGDWGQYYFGGFRPQTDFVAFNIEPYNAAEVTITITGVGPVKVGVVALGNLRLLGQSQYGAQSKINSFSRITTDDFGNTKFSRRRSARDISATAWLKLVDAPGVEDALDDLRDVPAVWIATDLPLYKGLRTFGIGSGGISYDHPNDCFLTIDVKGIT